MNISFPFKDVKVGMFGAIKRPIIPVSINVDGRQYFVEAIIDSGSDFCVLTKEIANAIGISDGQATEEIGIGGEKMKTKIGYATLTISDTKESVTLHSVPFHVPLEGGVELEEVIIGREPVFRDFDVIFRQNSNRIIFERSRRA